MHLDYKTFKFLDKEVFDIFESVGRKLDVIAEASVKGKKEIINKNPVVQDLLTKMDLSDVDAKKIKVSLLRYIFKSKKVSSN
jgi:hypothetical protein